MKKLIAVILSTAAFGVMAAESSSAILVPNVASAPAKSVHKHTAKKAKKASAPASSAKPKIIAILAADKPASAVATGKK